MYVSIRICDTSFSENFPHLFLKITISSITQTLKRRKKQNTVPEVK